MNFYFLPFKQSVKFPIFVYGRVKFLSVRGGVVIKNDNVKRGMIKLNKTGLHPVNSGGPLEIALEEGCEIVFHGNAVIHSGCRLQAFCSGSIVFGKEVYVSPQTAIVSAGNIFLDDYVVVAHQCQIFNTNFHYTVNVDSQKVARNTKDVVIGQHSWIGNRVTITKGVVLPSYTIVASNSLVNKSLCTQDSCIVGGIPAKILSFGYRRVLNLEKESFFNKWFSENEADYFIMNEISEQLFVRKVK